MDTSTDFPPLPSMQTDSPTGGKAPHNRLEDLSSSTGERPLRTNRTLSVPRFAHTAFLSSSHSERGLDDNAMHVASQSSNLCTYSCSLVRVCSVCACPPDRSRRLSPRRPPYVRWTGRQKRVNELEDKVAAREEGKRRNAQTRQHCEGSQPLTNKQKTSNTLTGSNTQLGPHQRSVIRDASHQAGIPSFHVQRWQWRLSVPPPLSYEPCVLPLALIVPLRYVGRRPMQFCRARPRLVAVDKCGPMPGRRAEVPASPTAA